MSGVKLGFIAVAITLTVAGVGCATSVVNALPAADPATAGDLAQSSDAAARPGDARLRIASPKSGEVLRAGPLLVSVSYSGPTLVPAAQATGLTDYHLHYLLDADARPYLGTGVAIPAGRPDILHSASTMTSFANVPAGDHTLTVVLGGSNHLAVDPPLVDQVDFLVQ